MKYSQFAQFSKLLESNNYTLEDWRKDPNLALIKEESEELSSEDKADKLETKSAAKDILNPRKALMRNKLNTNAKKIQEAINKGIVDKFIKPLINSKVDFYKKIAELKDIKNSKDLVQRLKAEINSVMDLQGKQIKNIQKTIQTSLDSASKKIETALQKSKMTDTAKADLTVYWSILSLQISNNLLNRFMKIDKEALEKTIKDPNLLKATKEVTNKMEEPLKRNMEEITKKIEGKETELNKGDSAKKVTPAEASTSSSDKAKEKSEFKSTDQSIKDEVEKDTKKE